MILPDLGLLRRRRDLRLLVGGSTVSSIGTAFTQVALAVQVFDLTDSTVAVGLLGVAQFIPIVALALIGGALADAFDRRKLIFGAELASAFVSAALLINALLPVAAAVGCCTWPRRCSRRRAPCCGRRWTRCCRGSSSATSSRRRRAISWSLMSISGIVGPALAGVVIAPAAWRPPTRSTSCRSSARWRAFALMRTPPPPPDAEPPSLRGVVEGVKYAWSRQEILGSYAIDMSAMFFAMPFALFPAVAERYGGTEVVGLLWAAPAVGAIVAMLTSGWSARVHHNGRAIVFAAAGLGRVHRAVRVRGLALARAAGAGVGGRGGRDQRHLPWRAVERDDPGPAARPARGAGDDLVVVGAAARQRARGLRRVVARASGRRSSPVARSSSWAASRSLPRCRGSGTTTREREVGARPRR